MKRNRPPIIVVLVGSFLGLVARGDTATLTPSRDNTLYQNAAGTTSNGAGSFVFTGRTAEVEGNAIRRALIFFDIAGNLPGGSTIDSVQLTLNMSRTRLTTGRVTTLHRVQADWGEGTSNASGEEGMGTAAAPGDATWLHTFFSTDLWTTAGGDFVATPSASTSVGGLGSYSWGSTAQMVADAQSWLDDPAGNFGWILMGDENESSTAKRFDSRENFSKVDRPMLTIDFKPLNPYFQGMMSRSGAPF